MGSWDSLVRGLLLDRIDAWAEREPDRPALQWKTGPYVTYGQLATDVARLAAGFSELGVKAGDAVLLMLPNNLELIKCWLAVNHLGAIEVPVNTQDRGRFLSHVINDSTARVMVVDRELIPALGAIAADLTTLAHLVVVGSEPARVQWPWTPYEAVEQSTSRCERHPVDHRDMMAILYTSGTTGPAKGVMMTYGHASLCVANLVRVMDLGPDDTYFVCMPLFHSNAQVIQVMPALMVGAKASIWPRFEADKWLDQVRSAGATVSNTLGVMCDYLFALPERPDDGQNPLRRLQTIPLPQSIAAAFERRFEVLCIDGYGLTDVGVVSYRRPDEPLVPGASGRPVDGYEVIVADPLTDEPLPAGTVGEIMIRPQVPFAFMAGYWHNPEATLAAWRNLWFHTGDAGYVDREGHLYFHDRLKDSIRVRGENVSSSQVEHEFLRHPAVYECSAVAVPSEHGDQEIKLYVVLRPDWKVEPHELLAACAPEMPLYAVPRYIEFTSELPKTPTGKVRKVELRALGITDATWDRRQAGYLVPR